MTAGWRRAGRLFAGMLVGNLVGGVISLILSLWFRLSPDGSDRPFIILPSLTLVPFCIGLSASWVWRRLDVSMKPVGLHSLSCTVVGLVGAVVCLREGAVCLVIASPILYLVLLLGAVLGGIWFKSGNVRGNTALIPLFMILTLVEPATRVDGTSVVTDEILIHASPAKVWPHVTAFPDIQTPPRFWLFKLGLPMPMSTTTAGDFVGADRQCIFSGGAVFREKVTEAVPNRRLAFDIVGQPDNPELFGHLTAQRGEFLLRDNLDGTTTLIGSTWYSLHVRPLWYFDAWTRYIFRQVHLRVMDNVKAAAESPAGADNAKLFPRSAISG